LPNNLVVCGCLESEYTKFLYIEETVWLVDW